MCSLLDQNAQIALAITIHIKENAEPSALQAAIQLPSLPALSVERDITGTDKAAGNFAQKDRS